MLKTKFKPLDREQFSLLRESKRLVASEFGKELSLQDKDILDQIYGFALESETDRLYEIFNQMHSSLDKDQKTDSNKSTVVQGDWGANKATGTSRAELVIEKKVKMGDVIDGQKCVGFYRGHPMFK